MEKTEQMKPILTYEKLKGLLPEISQVFFTLGDIRGSAAQYRSHLSREDFEPYPYANIIGILGGRGSGKTTVFSTIRTILESGQMPLELEKEPKISGGSQPEDAQGQSALDLETVKAAFSPDDLHIKPIVPEVLETSADILGVILLKLKDIIISNSNTLAKYYKKRDASYPSGFESCPHSEKLPLEEQWEKVFRSYLVRADGYNEISSRNYSSLADYTKERQESLDAEVRLGGQIYDLFTQISTAFSNGEGNCLIHFYIDDADIDGKRCMETMQLILRYLKHPNVVVFISGDINKFEEVLLIQQLIQGKPGIMIKDSTSLTSMRRQAKDYIYELLKKVMPYSNRYFLQQLDTQGKQHLQYPGDLDKNGTFADFLSNRLFYKITNSGDSRVFPSCVYDIFDSKPRGIITIWEFIEKNFPGKQSHILPTSDITFRNLLRNITEVNDLFFRYKENILKQWIQISSLKHLEDQHLKVTVNYDKFINFVTQYLQVESDSFTEESRKTFPEIKRERQESLCCIVFLFYFCEKFSFADSGDNTEPEGKKYSAMLNAIVAADDDHLVYYSTPEASHVLELFTQLQQVMGIDQQALIYSERQYFLSYKKVLDEKITDKSASHMDTRWNSQYETAEQKFSNGVASLMRELTELFDGVDYDRTLLLSSRSWKEWFPCDSDDNLPSSTNLETIKKYNLQKIELDLINIRVQFQIKQVLGKGIYFNEKMNENELTGNLEKQKNFFMNIVKGNIVTDAPYYLDIKDGNFLRRIKNIKNQYSPSKDIIHLLCIIKKFAIKKLHLNSGIARATVTHLKKNYKIIYLYGSLYEYQQAIWDLLNTELPNSTLCDLSGTLLDVKKTTEKNTPPEGAFENIYFSQHSCFIDENFAHENQYVVIQESTFEDKSGSWQTRRNNAVQVLMACEALAYIAIRCDELLDNFFFINSFELHKHLKNWGNEENEELTHTYDSINDYYYVKYLWNVTGIGEINSKQTALYTEIRELRGKIEDRYNYYTPADLNLSALNRLLKEIRTDAIYPEAAALKNDLESAQQIAQRRWEQFSEKLSLYIESFRTENPYYAITLEQIQKDLLQKEEIINHAELVEDIKKEEEKRIYQTEYEALILIAKAYLEAKQVE